MRNTTMSWDGSRANHALLVESDLFFAGRIISVLERAGDTVDHVLERPAAEEALRSRPHDLMLINLAPSYLGGVDTIRFAKRISPNTKVIAYLSHTKIPDVRAEVLAAGADRLCANSAITLRLPDIVRSVIEHGEIGIVDE